MLLIEVVEGRGEGEEEMYEGIDRCEGMLERCGGC